MVGCCMIGDENLRELVSDWLDKAEADFKTAEYLMTSPSRLHEIICFHAQQACEKTLKAYLTALQIPFGKTHRLKELIQSIEKYDSALAASLADVDVLSLYSVAYRYPGDYPVISDEMLNRAMSLMRKTKSQILAALGETGEEV